MSFHYSSLDGFVVDVSSNSDRACHHRHGVRCEIGGQICVGYLVAELAKMFTRSKGIKRRRLFDPDLGNIQLLVCVARSVSRRQNTFLTHAKPANQELLSSKS